MFHDVHPLCSLFMLHLQVWLFIWLTAHLKSLKTKRKYNKLHFFASYLIVVMSLHSQYWITWWFSADLYIKTTLYIEICIFNLINEINSLILQTYWWHFLATIQNFLSLIKHNTFIRWWTTTIIALIYSLTLGIFFSVVWEENFCESYDDLYS